MSEPLELLTPLDTFHDLHIQADTRKAMIKVSSEALRHLLIDHSTMLNELQRHGVKARTTPPKRRHKRLQN